MKTATETVTVFGIADCHGIESILPADEHEREREYLAIRACSNRQRHTVLYEAVLTNEQHDQIETMLDRCEFIEALVYLKENHEELRIQKDQAKSWNLIPNSKLDPWN